MGPRAPRAALAPAARGPGRDTLVGRRGARAAGVSGGNGVQRPTISLTIVEVGLVVFTFEVYIFSIPY